MKFKATYDDLNDMFEAIGSPITLRYKGNSYIEMIYDPGALLPNIILNLRYKGNYYNVLYFDYICEKGSLLISAANFFSMFPEGVCVKDQRITIDIKNLKIFKKFRGTCLVRNFIYGYNEISAEFYTSSE